MFMTKPELEEETRRWTALLVTNCPRCGGRGWVDADGKAAVCACRRNVERNVRLVDWGLPRKFLGDEWSLDLLAGRSFEPTVRAYVDGFDDNYVRGGGLLLTGPHGRGKTTLACIVAKHVAGLTHPWRRPAGPYQVAFAMFDDVVGMQFDNAQAGRLNALINRTDLLILDNVGAERARNDRRTAQRLLENIIRQRDNACLPLVITTNLDEQGLAEEYSPDVRDFLLQNDDAVYVAGDSHRTPADVDEFTF